MLNLIFLKLNHGEKTKDNLKFTQSLDQESKLNIIIKDLKKIKFLAKTVLIINEELIHKLDKIKLLNSRKTKRKSLKYTPMTKRMYYQLLEKLKSYNYKSIRLRLAFCLLVITGIQINHLVSLKIKDIDSLMNSHYMIISSLNRYEKSSYKIILTEQGKKIVNDRKKDFQFLSENKDSNFYLFTSQSNFNCKISRQTMTKDLNEIMNEVSQTFTDYSKITSYSFRTGYIFELSTRVLLEKAEFD